MTIKYSCSILSHRYSIQLVSLGGLHNNAAATGQRPDLHRYTRISTHDEFTAELSHKFHQDGMLAYVNEVQRKEKAIGCDVLTHQKWFVKS